MRSPGGSKRTTLISCLRSIHLMAVGTTYVQRTPCSGAIDWPNSTSMLLKVTHRKFPGLRDNMLIPNLRRSCGTLCSQTTQEPKCFVRKELRATWSMAACMLQRPRILPRTRDSAFTQSRTGRWVRYTTSPRNQRRGYWAVYSFELLLGRSSASQNHYGNPRGYEAGREV
jgi:hypothetical protein